MNPRTNYPIPIPRSLPAARQGLAEGHANQYPDLYTLGVSQAMEFSKLAVESCFCINSMCMDFYKHFFWYPPGLEYFFEVQQKGFAEWMDYVGEQSTKLMRPFFERRSFTRSEPEPSPEEIAENIEAIEDGLDAVVGSYDDEILA